MPVSTYEANLIATAKAHGTAYQAPATLYLKLVTTQTTADTPGTEVTLGSYVPHTFAQSGWTNDAAGNLALTADITYPLATADYDGDVLCVEAWDTADDSGHMREWYDLASPLTVIAGQTPTILASDLTYGVS